jgi:hypothetical protein
MGPPKKQPKKVSSAFSRNLAAQENLLLVRFFAPLKTGQKGKLSVNHLVVSFPDNRRQLYMPTKKMKSLIKKLYLKFC